MTALLWLLVVLGLAGFGLGGFLVRRSAARRGAEHVLHTLASLPMLVGPGHRVRLQATALRALRPRYFKLRRPYDADLVIEQIHIGGVSVLVAPIEPMLIEGVALESMFPAASAGELIVVTVRNLGARSADVSFTLSGYGPRVGREARS